MTCADANYLVLHEGRNSGIAVHADEIDPDTGQVTQPFDLGEADAITATVTHQPSGTEIALEDGAGIVITGDGSGGNFRIVLDWADISAWNHDDQVTIDFTIWSSANIAAANGRAVFQVRNG